MQAERFQCIPRLGNKGLGPGVRAGITAGARNSTPAPKVPTVTCKSPVRPEGAEAGHRACVPRGDDARAAMLGAGNGNRYCRFRSVQAWHRGPSPSQVAGRGRIAGRAQRAGCHHGRGTLTV